MSLLDDIREAVREIQSGQSRGATKGSAVDRVYIYADEDGVVREHDHPAPRAQNRDGAGWPMVMKAGLACHSSQIDEFNQSAQEEGLTGVRWVPDGEYGGVCVVDSREDRNKLLKATQRFDRDAGYGDVAPENC